MPREIVVRVATLVEKWILPFVYLYFAWDSLNELDLWNKTGFWSAPLNNSDLVWVIRELLFFVMQFSIGIILFINRKPAERPRTLREVLVPLLASFFFITYSYIPDLPLALQNSLLPANRQESWAEAGLVVGAIGPALSAWGVLSLGRSFGILVSVRKVVLHGPYRYVRHPIYLGYFFLFGGIALADPSPALLILFPIHCAIMVWRARIEESRLAGASADYRLYQTQTGFFFPKLWLPNRVASRQ